jgi:hypothetical protein
LSIRSRRAYQNTQATALFVQQHRFKHTHQHPPLLPCNDNSRRRSQQQRARSALRALSDDRADGYGRRRRMKKERERGKREGKFKFKT